MSSNIRKYCKAFNASQFYLDLWKIERFPLNIFDLIKRERNFNILISSLKDYLRWNPSKEQRGIKRLEVKDAKCVFDPGKRIYLIIYNQNRPMKRVRFSLAHEFAHIALGHLNMERTEICRGGLDDVSYYYMEGEANTFAGNLLAPPIIINEIFKGRYDIKGISNFFDISESAVRDYRWMDYSEWLPMTRTRFERAILQRCASGLYVKQCSVCGFVSSISTKNFAYCPICGNRALKGEGQMPKKYPGIDVDENSRAKTCPCCDNEETQFGEHCIICGKNIVNHCTNVDNGYHEGCGIPLPGNARYCYKCGCKSTFLEDGLLKPWDYDENAKEEVTDDDSDLPF